MTCQACYRPIGSSKMVSKSIYKNRNPLTSPYYMALATCSRACAPEERGAHAGCPASLRQIRVSADDQPRGQQTCNGALLFDRFQLGAYSAARTIQTSPLLTGKVLLLRQLASFELLLHLRCVLSIGPSYKLAGHSGSSMHKGSVIGRRSLYCVLFSRK